MKRKSVRIALMMGLLIFSNTLQASFAQTVSGLRLNQATLTEALKRVGEMTGYEFFYHAEQLSRCGKRIRLEVEEGRLEEVLQEILSGTGFTYSVEDKTILIVPAPAREEQAKEVVLEGQVVDAADGSPLTGVTVVLEGTTVGAASDMDGKWSLRIPAGSYNILFSFIGYETKSIRFTGKNLAD